MILTRQRLDENLHAAAKAENEMEGRFFLNIIVAERAAVLELLAGENQALLIGRDLKLTNLLLPPQPNQRTEATYALFVLDLGLHVLNRVAGLDFKRDRFA